MTLREMSTPRVVLRTAYRARLEMLKARSFGKGERSRFGSTCSTDPGVMHKAQARSSFGGSQQRGQGWPVPGGMELGEGGWPGLCWGRPERGRVEKRNPWGKELPSPPWKPVEGERWHCQAAVEGVGSEGAQRP